MGFRVGLTGGIGSGKSTVARIFAGLGVDVFDADTAAREVVEPPSPALDAIRERHGPEILTASGILDRPRLRRLVFDNSGERKWLEDLLHPLIGERLRRQIDGSRSAYCMLVSPLLLETGQRRLIDRMLVVDVSRNTQLRRSLLRDGGDRATIEAIIDTQTPRDQRLAAAADIIDNEAEEDALPARVRSLHRLYLELAKSHE